MLLLLEAVIAQAHRVLDDVVRLAFVFGRRDAEVGPHAQAHELTAFQVVGECGGHRDW